MSAIANPFNEDIKILDAIAACGDKENILTRLIAYLARLEEENINLMVMLSESSDETRSTRYEHLAAQISAYRRIKTSAQCALNYQPESQSVAGEDELAKGGVL